MTKQFVLQSWFFLCITDARLGCECRAIAHAHAHTHHILFSSANIAHAHVHTHHILFSCAIIARLNLYKSQLGMR